MAKNGLRLSLAALIVLALLFAPNVRRSHAAASKALRKAQLLALVSGNVLDTTIVAEIRHRGLDFSPNDEYKSLLREAGASAIILAAVDQAKANPDAGSHTPQDNEFLKHLAHAGSLSRAGRNDEAAAELSAALSAQNEKLDAGFVMAHILIDQQRTGEAGSILDEIHSQDSEYPFVETRLAYVAMSADDLEGCLRHARAAIANNPDDAVAHMNVGAALSRMHKPDAAKYELEQAIRCNPKYELAYTGLGLTLQDLGDRDGAIAQFKKAVALKPEDVNAHYDLGNVYSDKQDFDSAIREFREAKRLDPQRVDVRQNLGASLMQRDPAAAIVEFKELAAISPDFPLCHQCLGHGYSLIGDYENAKKEYAIAIQTDPASPLPYVGLAEIDEDKKNYDAALKEYRQAQQIDPSDSTAYFGAGRVLFSKADFRASAEELHHAEQLSPADGRIYSLRGEALTSSGDLNSAIAEFKQSLRLDSKQVEPRLGLANALEKSGDWVGALEQYHRAAIDEPELKPSGVTQSWYDAQQKYKLAQQRFQAHLAELRSSGKSAEANDLEARLHAKESATNPDEKFHAAMQAAKQALMERRFDDAETSAKQAVSIAEKIQPMDGRLPEALGQLGGVYSWRRDFTNASDIFHRQLALSEKLYGAQSPEITSALQNLGGIAAAQQNFAEAEKYFTSSVDLNVKAYGENAEPVADVLRSLAHLYFMKKDFTKAESTLQRSAHIYETVYGQDDQRLVLPLTMLCSVYDQSSQPDKSQACHARLVTLAEKQFGANSPFLVRDLTAEAQALRQLGRNDEAAKLEQRAQSLPSAQTTPGPMNLQ